MSEANETTVAAKPKVGNFRWAICALLFFAATINYVDRQVIGILKPTLGVPIFQEQVIRIAMVAASFTGGEADQLRRAMASWGKTGTLLKFEKKFIVTNNHFIRIEYLIRNVSEKQKKLGLGKLPVFHVVG